MTSRRYAAGEWRSKRSSSATEPMPTSSRSPRTTSKRRCRSFTCAVDGYAGQRGWVIDKVEPIGTPGLVENYLAQFYGADDDVESGNGIPREVLVPELPDNVDALSDWLSDRRGSRVSIRVPQRGDKRSLLETVARNAAQAFVQHKLKRASDLTARSQALSELQEALGLADPPLRIECFDVSHVQGTNVVASMVVFEDGLPRKSEYRRFAIRGRGGDTDWIAEAVGRRFARYLDEQVADGATVERRGVRRCADRSRRAVGVRRPDRPDDRASAQVLLPAEPARRRRRRAAGRGGPGGAGRARHRRRRAGRAGQAAGRGLAARRSRTR